MNDKSIQENFLQGFKDSKEELTVFLLNGFQMKGTIVEFDDTVVNLKNKLFLHKSCVEGACFILFIYKV
ncbi:RNA chaperone Hfq [Staphylococcus simulans]|uniref:RNA chaperone Hfq n=1 Tax=Staphylococcus simulans TaxID=1286 RepID=UPI0027FDAF5F|nr:RNA chaperone Hfq [Staphylococcus simulans]MDQ7112027.1 RNA chaperone Hfq [Staphylococcus simulans]